MFSTIPIYYLIQIFVCIIVSFAGAKYIGKKDKTCSQYSSSLKDIGKMLSIFFTIEFAENIIFQPGINRMEGLEPYAHLTVSSQGDFLENIIRFCDFFIVLLILLFLFLGIRAKIKAKKDEM